MKVIVKNLFVFVFVVIGLTCRSQIVEADYKMTFNGKYNDSLYNLELKYIYSKGKSLQELSVGGGTQYKDTLLINPDGELYEYKAPIVLPSDIVVYKEFEKDSIYMQHSTNNEVRAIKDAFVIYDWKLHDDSKTILGYTCKKATTTIERVGVLFEIVAWYAPEINISDGPRDFQGLPGLILEVKSNSKIYLTAIKIKINSESELDLQSPEEEMFPVTYRQYNMIYRRGN